MTNKSYWKKMPTGRTLKSNALYFGYQGVMAIGFERKRRLGLALSKYLTSPTQPTKCKIFYVLSENKQQKQVFSTKQNTKHFPPQRPKEESFKRPLSPSTFTETCKNLRNAHGHRQFPGGPVVRITNVKSFQRMSSHNLSKK